MRWDALGYAGIRQKFSALQDTSKRVPRGSQEALQRLRARSASWAWAWAWCGAGAGAGAWAWAGAWAVLGLGPGPGPGPGVLDATVRHSATCSEALPSEIRFPYATNVVAYLSKTLPPVLKAIAQRRQPTCFQSIEASP